MQFTIVRYCQLGWWSTLVVAVLLPSSLSADEAKVKQLQKERLTVLQQIAELKERAFRHGEIPLSDCASAFDQAFEAELALCESDAERVKVREKMLERAKTDEEIVGRLKRAGEAGAWDFPTAVARRLAVEIELERLKK